MSDLRRTFFQQMEVIAGNDKDVMLLVGDLGYSFMERYIKKYPLQFINCGCAEQNMVSMAAGLALGGKKPYVYSGSIFIVMRAYEQLRDDVAYNDLDVKLIGTGASGFLGFTHNMEGTENEEDLLKNLPNLERFYPDTKAELSEALLTKGCAYVKL